jgi:hypothetical protein
LIHVFTFSCGRRFKTRAIAAGRQDYRS